MQGPPTGRNSSFYRDYVVCDVAGGLLVYVSRAHNPYLYIHTCMCTSCNILEKQTQLSKNTEPFKKKKLHV